jgi:hypothetical protein
VSDLLDWADAQCRVLADADADTLATRIWRIRMALETRHRQELDPGAAQSLLDRITSIREAEADLSSLRAILQTMGGPITWRETTDCTGTPSAQH